MTVPDPTIVSQHDWIPEPAPLELLFNFALVVAFSAQAVEMCHRAAATNPLVEIPSFIFPRPGLRDRPGYPVAHYVSQKHVFLDPHAR